MDLLLNIAVSVVVGVFTALATTYLALKRFRAEKLWEKKVDAYTRLISAAHEMKRTRDSEIYALRRGGQVSPEHSERIWQESHDAKRTILQLADAASFLISDEITRATSVLENSLDSAQDNSWVEKLANEQQALSAYLIELKQVARREIRA